MTEQEQRQAHVEWNEPWPGQGGETVYVVCRTTIQGAVSIQRNLRDYPTDGAALEDFLVVHWAWIVKDK
jgi:hypothetical protein